MRELPPEGGRVSETWPPRFVHKRQELTQIPRDVAQHVYRGRLLLNETSSAVWDNERGEWHDPWTWTP